MDLPEMRQSQDETGQAVKKVIETSEYIPAYMVFMNGKHLWK